jgi:hypothetical protein
MWVLLMSLLETAGPRILGAIRQTMTMLELQQECPPISPVLGMASPISLPTSGDWLALRSVSVLEP